ncbi:OrL16 [Eciton burchellii]|nr:OrL16 [Eciton burchellii]
MVKIVNIPWSNVTYEKDTIYALMWSRWILRLLGIWPLVYPNTTRMERILTTISFTLCWSALNFLIIPMSIFMLSDEITTKEKIKMLGPMGFALMAALKYFFLVVRHKSIRQCIHALSTDWRVVQQEEHRKIMVRLAEKGHTLSKFSIVFMYCGGLCWHTIMPFLSHNELSRNQNITLGPMPYVGFDLIFDLRPMSTHIFLFFAQWCSGLVLFNITIAVCCLANVFVSHTCGQIEIVMTRVQDFVKEAQKNRASSKRHMADIIKHHVETLRFSNYIEEVLGEICLVEIVASILIICLLEYYCMMEWANNDNIAILTYFFLLISFVFNVFVFCYISEQLTEQSSKVGYNSYKTEWYYLPAKIALDFILMISISHQPKKISAGKIVNLSFSSFSTVLKTSVAYLNLLRTFV